MLLQISSRNNQYTSVEKPVKSSFAYWYKKSYGHGVVRTVELNLEHQKVGLKVIAQCTWD